MTRVVDHRGAQQGADPPTARLRRPRRLQHIDRPGRAVAVLALGIRSALGTGDSGDDEPAEPVLEAEASASARVDGSSTVIADPTAVMWPTGTTTGWGSESVLSGATPRRPGAEPSG